MVFIVAGIMLSTLHQSSLGALYLLMPEKMSELWATNAIGPLFFVSAVIGGLSVVTLESIISSWAYNRKLELDLLSSLSKGLGMALLVYFAMKVTDLYARRVTVWQLDRVHFWFYVELFGTVALPALLITFREIRESRQGALVDCRSVRLRGAPEPLQRQPHLLWRLPADSLFPVGLRDYHHPGHDGRRHLDLRFPEPQSAGVSRRIDCLMPNPPDQELETALEAYTRGPAPPSQVDPAGGGGAAASGRGPGRPAVGPGKWLTRKLKSGCTPANLSWPTCPSPHPSFARLWAGCWSFAEQFELLPPLPSDVLQALLSLPPPAWLAENLGLADLCQGREVPAGLLLFLGQKALSPYYQRAAAPFGPLFLQGSWQQGNCPNCGQKPALASLAPESGQKLLYCSLCAVQWPFSRRACVFCGQEEPHFSYVFVEDDPARRADLCQACRGYLKTMVTGRLTHPLCLPLEEFVTSGPGHPHGS